MKMDDWYPLVPSHYLRAGDNIVAGFLPGQEVALWRAEGGVVQAWENRCPHRGVRLTLGRIHDNRLSCAYHGWEYAADTGRCAAIPAHPEMPVPKQVGVKTFAAAEAHGMVWVRQGSEGFGSEPPSLSGPQPGGVFCRTLELRADGAATTEVLKQRGFTQVGAHTWRGSLAEQACTVLLNTPEPAQTFAHAWLDSEPATGALEKFQAELRLLRRDVEALTDARRQA